MRHQLLKTLCLAFVMGFSGHAFADESINTNEDSLVVNNPDVEVAIAYPVDYSYTPCPYLDCPPVCGPICGPPCRSRPWNFNLSADYLYWQVRSEELPYAESFVVTELVGGATLGVPTIERIKVNTSSGVRLGVGSLIPCSDCWEISADWTHLHSKSKNSVQGPFILPIWINNFIIATPTAAAAQYDFTINMADLSVERGLCVGRRWTLSPSVGLRGVWIDQDLDVGYTSVDGFFKAKNSIHLKGGGVRTGLSSKLRLCGGLSLMGWSYVDLIWSHVKVKQLGLEPDGTTRNGVNDSLYTVNPVIELFLGLSWEQCVCRTRWQARLGWEEQYFINGVQFNKLVGSTDLVPSNVTIHQLGGLGLGGLTAGLKVCF